MHLYCSGEKSLQLPPAVQVHAYKHSTPWGEVGEQTNHPPSKGHEAGCFQRPAYCSLRSSKSELSSGAFR
eukprot:3631755-Amphidinium_carterae.1